MRFAIMPFLAILAGCGFGHVNQGQVVAYHKNTGMITLVADSNYREPDRPRFDVVPAITIHRPDDPRQMGPAPEPGKLLALDAAHSQVIVYDSATGGLRAVPYTLISEQDGIRQADPRVAGARFPQVDRSSGAITVYWPHLHKLMEFSVPPQFRDLPEDTWRIGDEIRYYYKDPAQALRLMNVSKTDLDKAGK
ncbi:MAG TPA: DUF4881 domain-containing protein [Bryobacteraceae bacterium]|nr:DUF4881 domain-containing protein [Bryobacteraceae bacterium]